MGNPGSTYLRDPHPDRLTHTVTHAAHFTLDKLAATFPIS